MSPRKSFSIYPLFQKQQLRAPLRLRRADAPPATAAAAAAHLGLGLRVAVGRAAARQEQVRLDAALQHSGQLVLAVTDDLGDEQQQQQQTSSSPLQAATSSSSPAARLLLLPRGAEAAPLGAPSEDEGRDLAAAPSSAAAGETIDYAGREGADGNSRGHNLLRWEWLLRSDRHIQGKTLRLSLSQGSAALMSAHTSIDTLCLRTIILGL